jgi:putative ABC transport system permease protein
VLTLALRNIFRQRGRTLLTLGAIAIGVASLVLCGGFIEDILVQLREATIRSQLGHLQVHKRGYFASGGQQPYDFLIDRAEVVNQAVAGVPAVQAHARRLAFSGLLSNGRGALPILGEGVEPEAEARIGSAMSILSGRALGPGDEFGILIGEGLASAMKLKVGDSLNLLLNTRDGAMNTLDFQVVGVFRSLSKEYDARAVRIPLAAAQSLTGTEGVNAIVLLLSATELTDRVAVALGSQLPKELEVKRWYELADFYANTAALYQRQFGVLQLIIMVMLFLSVANSVNMTLHERTLEFGIMRALGRTSRHVFRLALLEMALMGAAGAVLGVLVGVGLAAAISHVGIPMPPPPNSESGFTAAIRVVPTVVAMAFFLGLLATALASLLPARKVARIPVVEALRRAV